jgi:hypothetical protein
LDLVTDVVRSSFNALGDILFIFLSPGAAGDFVCQAERGQKEKGEDLAEEAYGSSDGTAAGKEAA